MTQFSHVPSLHLNFLETSIEKLKNDARILGVAAGGSFILKRMDEFSDLDLVIFTQPKFYDEVIHERKIIAGDLGPLLESFTGEHVGEPRLLICLYGPPLLHVDLKFISLDQIKHRVEDPEILWERSNIISKNLFKTVSKFPEPDIDWIENRFWVWIHYIAQRIGRGELFEAVDALNFIRGKVLGPMLLKFVGARPQGVRRIENYCSNYLDQLKRTIPSYDELSCISSLKQTIDLYRLLRDKMSVSYKYRKANKVETESVKYLDEIKHMIQLR